LNLISQFSGKSVSSFNLKGLYLFPEHEKMDSKEKKKKMKFLFDAIITDPNDETILNRKKCIGIKETIKKVPRWSYNLIEEIEELERTGEPDYFDIRSRKAKRVVILNDNSENEAISKDKHTTFLKDRSENDDTSDVTYTDPEDTENSNDDTYTDTKDTENDDEKDEMEIALIRYTERTDSRRDIIIGSRRDQRRKTVTWKLFQKGVHSPLFLDKIYNDSSVDFEIIEPVLDEEENDEAPEEKRIEIAETWESIIYAQVLRSFLLVTQSIIRKYILLPSLIITKNIVRILLLEFPEWSEDFRDWNREIHIICAYNGGPFSGTETELEEHWLTRGIQIKILFPFRLKPWHKSKLRSPQKEKDPMKKKAKKIQFCYLTVFGMEVDLPFSSSPKNKFFVFEPIVKELQKIRKRKKGLKELFKARLNEKKRIVLNVLKEKIKNLPLSSLLLNFGLRKIDEKIDKLNKNQKDSTISNSNPMIYKSVIRINRLQWTNCSLIEKKIKAKNDRKKTIIKQIEKITDDKRLELQKNIWQIFQRRNVRLVYKSLYSFKFIMERVYKVYIDIFGCIINIIRINVELFFESIKKSLNKYIYNNETNEERIAKKNKSIMSFISTRNCNIRNMNSRNFCDVSSLSQAYVFYQLSQTQFINLYKSKLRSIFEYNGTPLFLKNEIKDYFFGVQGIFHSKLKHKNPPNYVMNQWTNWLKGHYQYDLSQSRWSRLVTQKWRKRMNEYYVAHNKDLTKCHSYENKRLIHYKKKEVDSLKKKKKKKKKEKKL